MSAAPHERPDAADLATEQALLGAILLNNAAYSRVSTFLKPGHFLNAVHGRIFVAIGTVIARGLTAEIATVRDELGPAPALEPIGGVAAFLAALLTSAGIAANAEHYGRAIRDAAVQRASAAFSVTAWLDRDISEPDILLGPFSTTSRGMFVADTGLGKTNVAMAIAFAMASGQPFLHWNSHRPARVLFIDGEMSKRLLRSRIRDEAKRCGQIPETLFFVSSDDVEDMPPLNTAQGQAYVDSLIDGFGGIDFIFFDNVQSLLSGDMKDEEPWQQTLPWIRDLTRRNIGQLWIHHTGHDTGRSYGTKTREWQLDTVMIGEAVERAGADIAMSLRFTKARERAPDNRHIYADVVVTLSCDAWTIDTGPAPKKAQKLSGAAAVGMEQLRNCLAMHAADLPPSEHVPKGARGVTLHTWRLWLEQAGVINRDGNPREQFRRIRVTLQERGFIGVWGDFVWPSHAVT